MSPDVSSLDELSEMISDTVIGSFIIRMLEFYGSFGPLPGILLPFIEAFLPFLPLIVFILANSIVYGLVLGFVFSWIGAVSGAILLFILLRRLQRFEWVRRIKEQKQVKKVTSFFDRRGFGLVFILFCFPFSPSALINVVAAFTKMSLLQFALAIMLGKTVMIFSVAFIGDSFTSFATNPIRTTLLGVLIVSFWMLGKWIEKRFEKATDKVESEVNHR